MSFISTKLLLLVFIAAVIYYLMPKKYQWILLLVVSYIFYAASGTKTIGFIIFTTITTFLGGILLQKSAEKGKKRLVEREGLSADEKKMVKAQTKRNKRLICTCVLLANFGVLAFLKYFNFAVLNLNLIMDTLGVNSHFATRSLLLPLGISFYTFQSMSYIIDIYQ